MTPRAAKLAVLWGLLLGLLIMGQAKATTWYVRPAGGSYGSEDGTSYDNAWDGIEDIVWGSVAAGDTVYICGRQMRTLSGGSWCIRPDFTNGADDDHHTTIRGDYPGDPGTIWGYGTPASWTDNGDGTYKWQLTCSTGAGFIRDIQEDNTYSIMSRVYSLQDCNDTEDTFYADAFKTGHYLYVHMPSEADPTGRVWVPRTGYDLYLDEVSYVTFKSLSIYITYQWIDSGDAESGAPSYITFDGCYIYGCNDYWWGPCSHITWTGCELENYSSGAIYAVEWPRDHSGACPSYFTIENCIIHDVRGTSDSHAVGTQGVNHFTIQNNEFYDCGSGPNINLQDGDNSPTTDVVIRWNYIHDMHTEDGASGEGIKLGALDAESQSDWTGCEIYGNVIANCTNGIAISWADVDVPVYNNTVYDCSTSYRYTHTGEWTTVHALLKNNISHAPSSYHVSYNTGVSNAANIVSNYNCFYPISGSQFVFISSGTVANPTTWASWQGLSESGCVFDPNSMVTDPNVIDVESGDFQLDSMSPCIDAGVDLGFQYDDVLDPDSDTADWVNTVSTFDHDLHGTGWDIGAYVYENPNWIPSVYYMIIRSTNP